MALLASRCTTTTTSHSLLRSSPSRLALSTLSLAHSTPRPRSLPRASSLYPQRRTFFWSSASTSTSSAPLNPFAGTGAGQASWESLSFLPQISPELLPFFFALLLASQEDDDDDGAAPLASSSSDAPPPYSVKAVSSKGLGAFASREISRGEVILSERPLCIWPSKLDASRAKEMVDSLSPSARKAYLSLANAASPEMKMDEVLAIRATNGFNVQLPPLPSHLTPATLSLLGKQSLPSSASFIFPKIARINHSCAPNADHAMNWKNLKMTVYATTSILPNEEICIEYTPSLVQKTRDERREILKRDFGFDCHCRICSQEGEALAQSDSRRREIDAIVGALGSGSMDRKAMWAAMGRVQYLLEKEGYRAMPEFDNERISTAYVGFVDIKQQREQAERA